MVIDTLGFYNPLPDPPQVVIDEEKALKWLRRGAQPSEPVARLLAKSGILQKVGGQE
jgi:small subunit ribosomal protein S16